MRAEMSIAVTSELPKMNASNGRLSPLDRACVRLCRAQGFSVANAALINLTSQASVSHLTSTLPRPLASEATIGEARAVIRQMVADDVGLDAEADIDVIESILGLACQKLADRIEVAMQSERGRSRFAEDAA